jgi:hypothetical protein
MLPEVASAKAAGEDDLVIAVTGNDTFGIAVSSYCTGNSAACN